MLYLDESVHSLGLPFTFLKFPFPARLMAQDHPPPGDPPPAPTFRPDPPTLQLLPRNQPHSQSPLLSTQIESSRRTQQENESELERSMRAMQLSARDDASLGLEDEDVVQSQYSILLKVADPLGTARPVPIRGLRTDMRKAWRRSYWAISEVKKNLFVASFKTISNMQFVWENQPWTVGRAREVLLLELLTPNKKPADYKFQYLHTTVRFYGLPDDLRKVYILKYLINEIGEPSDFEKIKATSLFNDPEYVAARVKIDITAKAKDKVRFWLGTDSYTYVYVHYEKINRICTYCAAFFHNADHCPERHTRLILAEATADSQPVPFEIFGLWMTQTTAISKDLMQEQLQSISHSERTSDQLRQLRAGFSALSTKDEEENQTGGKNTASTTLITHSKLQNKDAHKGPDLQSGDTEPMLQDLPTPTGEPPEEQEQGKQSVEDNPMQQDHQRHASMPSTEARSKGTNIFQGPPTLELSTPPYTHPTQTQSKTLQPINPQYISPDREKVQCNTTKEAIQTHTTIVSTPQLPTLHEPDLPRTTHTPHHPTSTEHKPPHHGSDLHHRRLLSTAVDSEVASSESGGQVLLRKPAASWRRHVVGSRRASSVPLQLGGQQYRKGQRARRSRSPSKQPEESDATSANRGPDSQPRRRRRRWDVGGPAVAPADLQVHTQWKDKAGGRPLTPAAQAPASPRSPGSYINPNNTDSGFQPGDYMEDPGGAEWGHSVALAHQIGGLDFHARSTPLHQQPAGQHTDAAQHLDGPGVYPPYTGTGDDPLHQHHTQAMAPASKAPRTP